MKPEYEFPKLALTEFLDTPISEFSYRKLSEKITLEQLISHLNKPFVDYDDAQIIIKAIEKSFSLRNLRSEILRDDKIYNILVQASRSPHSEIRKLLSNSLELCSRDEDNIQYLESQLIIETIFSLLISEELEIFSSAEKTLLQVFKSSSEAKDNFVQSALSQSIIDKLKNCDETIKFRILGFFVSLGKLSNDIFNYVEEVEIYDKVLQLSFSNDLITKINAIELVNELASFPRGIDFLCKGDFPTSFLRELRDCQFQPTETSLLYVLSEIIKKYPNLAPRIFNEQSEIFNMKLKEYLFDGMTFKDGGAKLICFLTCWSNIVYHPVGFNLINMTLPESFKHVANFVSGIGGREVTICSISAWTKALKGSCVGLLKPHVENELINKLLSQLLDDLFQDFRADSYILLEALFRHYSLSAVLFFNNEKHRKLLLDGYSDTQIPAKHAKYNFATTAYKLHTPIIIDLAGHDYLKLLELYIQGGPFYNTSDAKLSVEDLSL